MTDENGKLRSDIIVSAETVEIIYTIHELLKEMRPTILSEVPKMVQLMSTVAAAQTAMSAAATTMAATHEKAEKRFEKLENKLQDCNNKVAGDGRMPITSHYMVLGGTVLITILTVLYVNKQSLDATLTSLKIGQKEVQKEIINRIDEKLETNTKVH